ncbi:uncharacterized protein NKAPD1 [Gouania willdenowi]|uniref:NKAP domain containing 1 n=1 Tax=Gouania willdenowi TaxID=441366 RepID=A0A8C5E5W7_GOUWI|nr:uncharacterized protein NKAPD1 [Gouania willdenowi]
MSKQSIGKTLLRNVIRHTDAHNKIQEEMDMWKMRDWETQRSRPQNLSDPACLRHMHCDRVPGDLSQSRVSEHDDRESRYWSRKLYEFEAKDPDRWGHSGFKELYPEEFESDSEKSCDIKSSGHRKLKKSKTNKQACLSKRLKKSSRKKKKKKVVEKHKKVDCPSSDSSSDDDSSAIKDKQRKKGSKHLHKNKKTSKSKERDLDTSDEDTDKAKKDRRTNSLKKRKHKASESVLNSKKRRKNWKVAGVECSDDSSTD